MIPPGMKASKACGETISKANHAPRATKDLERSLSPVFHPLFSILALLTTPTYLSDTAFMVETKALFLTTN